MTTETAVKEQLKAFQMHQPEFHWRTTLMMAVLHVSRPGAIRAMMAKVDPDFHPDERTLRSLLESTREKMGLPLFPSSAKGGRPSDAVSEKYRSEHCARWIRENGGLPRVEQLADPSWNLKPNPPQNLQTSSTEPAKSSGKPSKSISPEPNNLQSPVEEMPSVSTEDPLAPEAELRGIDRQLDALEVTPDFPGQILALKSRQFFLVHGEEPESDQIRDWYPGIAREMADAGLSWTPPA